MIMAVTCWLMNRFLLLLGIPGNVVSAIVFYRQGLRERINVCLFILALADLVSVVILLLMYVEDRVRKHFNPNSLCKVTYLGNERLRCTFSFCLFGSLTSTERASQFLSAVISCERCFCVVSPLHAKRLLKTSTITAIVVVCCVVLMTGMCVIVIPKHTVGFIYDPTANILKSFAALTKYYLENKKIIDLLDIFVLSTVVTRMLIGTSILFLICVMPNIIVQIFSLLLQELNSTSMYFTLNFALWDVVHMCRGVRSSVHFCVYYIMGSKFREYVHSVCSGRTF